MAFNKPLFSIDIPNMQASVNSYKGGHALVHNILFPNKYTPKFDLKGLEGDEGIPVTADKVAFDTKAPLKTRKVIGSWSGELAKIAVARKKNEREINEYNDLQTIANNNTEDKQAAMYLVNLVYDDITFVQDAMEHRVELDTCRLGSRGKVVFEAGIDGDVATNNEINFNVPADNFKGAKKPWSTISGSDVVADASADGLGDIIKAQKAVAKTGAPKPMFAILEQDTFELLCQQTAVAKRLFPQVADLSVVTGDMISLEAINAYMSRNGYPTLIVIDTYVTIEGKDGSHKTIKPWNENVVTLSRTAQLGWNYYKPVPMIANVEALQVQGSFYKVTRYSDLNPMLEVTMAEAYVQAGLINRNSLVFLNVNKTTWNDGQR